MRGDNANRDGTEKKHELESKDKANEATKQKQQNTFYLDSFVGSFN